MADLQKPTYLSEIPIGTLFYRKGHPTDICKLTHKLGENGYAGTTYPFRFTYFSENIESSTNLNLEIELIINQS